MKVTIERSVLLKALGHVHRIVEKRNTIPILSNVLIEAADGSVALKSTDLDLEATEQIPADVEQAGATTVAAHVIYDIVRKLPEGAQVEPRNGRRDGTAPAALGPVAVLSSGPARLRFSRPHARRVLAPLRHAVGRAEEADRQQPVRHLHGGDALLSERHLPAYGRRPAGRAMLRAVATDGHRLARVETPAPQGAAGMPGIIAPRKAVNEVLKLLEDPTKEVQVEISTAKARFQFGDVVLTTKLIDGTFPDYARVIPTGNDKRLVVDKEPFEKAVDRVSTLSSERGRAIKLSIGDGKMTLSVNNPDSGSASEEIEVDYDSDPIDIGFNARYLLDILGQLSGDTALIKLADPGLADADPGPRRGERALRPDAAEGVTSAKARALRARASSMKRASPWFVEFWSWRRSRRSCSRPPGRCCVPARRRR